MAATSPPRAAPARRDWSWRSQQTRGLIYQVVALAAIAFVVWFLAHNTLLNMRTRGIQSGFDFLLQPAGFDIGEQRGRDVPPELLEEVFELNMALEEAREGDAGAKAQGKGWGWRGRGG